MQTMEIQEQFAEIIGEDNKIMKYPRISKPKINTRFKIKIENILP